MKKSKREFIGILSVALLLCVATVASASVDGGSYGDLLISRTSTFDVFLGSAGGFGTATNYDPGLSGPLGRITAGEVTGDDKLDVFVATDKTAGDYATYQSGVGGALTPAYFGCDFNDPADTWFQHRFAFGDITANGLDDMMSFAAEPGTGYFKYGQKFVTNPAGTMTRDDSGYYNTWNNSQDYDAGDVNGDGYADMFVSNSDATLRGWLNNAGSWSYPLEQFAGATPEHVEISDINGDGFEDLIIVPLDAKDTIVVYPGHAGWLLGGDVSLPAIAATIDTGDVDVLNIACGDIDGDGYGDIVYNTSATGNSVGIYNGASDMNMGTASFFDTGGAIVEIGIAEPIPEPATLSLLLVGTVAMVIRKRR